MAIDRLGQNALGVIEDGVRGAQMVGQDIAKGNVNKVRGVRNNIGNGMNAIAQDPFYYGGRVARPTFCDALSARVAGAVSIFGDIPFCVSKLRPNPR